MLQLLLHCHFGTESAHIVIFQQRKWSLNPDSRPETNAVCAERQKTEDKYNAQLTHHCIDQEVQAVNGRWQSNSQSGTSPRRDISRLSGKEGSTTFCDRLCPHRQILYIALQNPHSFQYFYSGSSNVWPSLYCHRTFARQRRQALWRVRKG